MEQSLIVTNAVLYCKSKHVSERTTCGRLITFLHGLVFCRKALQGQRSEANLIAGVFEGDHVMCISGDDLGIFTVGKNVLTQEEHGHVLMVRVFGEEIEYSLVVATFIHQIV